MIDNTLVHLALRSRLLTLSVATTGSATLGVTGVGSIFTRTAGSFLTDGFATGMELVSTGFAAANNVTATVLSVSALAMTVNVALVDDAPAAARTLAVGVPALFALTNIDFDMVTGRPYISEDFVPGPAAQVTLGPLGAVETFPLYTVNLFGVANTGLQALTRMADAILTLFAPRTDIVLSTGDVVRIRSSPAPYAGPLTQASPGWAFVPVTIPCWIRSPNVI